MSYQQTGARHERVSRKMIRAMAKQMYATVSESRDEKFADSAGWLNLFHRHNIFNWRKEGKRRPHLWAAFVEAFGFGQPLCIVGLQMWPLKDADPELRHSNRRTNPLCVLTSFNTLWLSPGSYGGRQPNEILSKHVDVSGSNIFGNIWDDVSKQLNNCTTIV